MSDATSENALEAAIGKPKEERKPQPRKDMWKIADQVQNYIARYCVLPHADCYPVVALWVLHTHVIDALDTTPRLLIDSATPQCGKSRLLEVIEDLAQKPMLAVNATPAAIIRAVDAAPWTVLFDEVDTIYSDPKGKEELTAIINAGYRRGATVPRAMRVGEDFETVFLNAFAPVALAGITSNIPDAVRSRSIQWRMRKRIPSREPVAEYRRRLAHRESGPLRAAMAAWGQSAVVETLSETFPELPDGVTDRNAEIWEPLIAVADAIGGHWPDTARQACAHFVNTPSTSVSLGVEMLVAIHRIMEELATDDIATSVLLSAFKKMGDESPWPSGWRELNARTLAEVLRPFGVEAGQFKVGATKHRGYRRRFPDREGGLFDAFARHVPGAEQDDILTRRIPAVTPITGIHRETVNGETRLRFDYGSEVLGTADEDDSEAAS